MRKLILIILICLILIITGCTAGGKAIAGQPSYEQLLNEIQQLHQEMDQRERECDQKINQIEDECERRMKKEELKEEQKKLQTRAVLQCQEFTAKNPNSFVTVDPKRCGTKGLLGYVFMNKDAQPNLVGVWDCSQEDTRYEYGMFGKRTDTLRYYDSFLSLDPNCEGKRVNSFLGYLPKNAIPGITKATYRIWEGGIPAFNHLLTQNPAGVGQAEVTFNFLMYESGMPSDN